MCTILFVSSVCTKDEESMCLRETDLKIFIREKWRREESLVISLWNQVFGFRSRTGSAFCGVPGLTAYRCLIRRKVGQTSLYERSDSFSFSFFFFFYIFQFFYLKVLLLFYFTCQPQFLLFLLCLLPHSNPHSSERVRLPWGVSKVWHIKLR